MSLWLVRHAQPVIAPGLCYGHSNVAAEVEATAQAAERLALVLPQRAKLLVSDLGRTCQLAEALVVWRPDLQIHLTPALREMNFGAWEMCAWASLTEADFAPWMADFANHPVGGGESVAQLLQRVGELWQRYRQSSQPEVWITHAGVIRALHYLKNANPLQPLTPAQWPTLAVGYGEWVALDAPTTHSVAHQP